MASKDAIETAYCFLHQKQRVYQYSTMEWQKDDIEYAISDFVEKMDAELYAELADGRRDFLLNHVTFADDITIAIERLEKMPTEVQR